MSIWFMTDSLVYGLLKNLAPDIRCDYRLIVALHHPVICHARPIKKQPAFKQVAIH